MALKGPTGAGKNHTAVVQIIATTAKTINSRREHIDLNVSYD